MTGSESDDVEVIFFDLDGTLYDKEEAQRRALLEIVERYEGTFGDVDKDDLVGAFRSADKEGSIDFEEGVPLDRIRFNRARRTMSMIGIDEAFADKFNKEFLRLYPTIDVEIEGAERVVEELAGRYELGIISNGSKEIQLTKLRTLDLIGHFDELIFSEEIGSRKPDQQIFSHALDRVDRRSERCLYVGDSYVSDIEGAKRAGMHACWLNIERDGIPGDPRHDIEISELSELLDILL